MMDVHVEDFQGIKDLDLTIDGFTTLVGRSNIGKSSVRRAIHGLLVNKRGDYFVRNGASNSLVRVSCPELDATWEKGSSKNDYIVDGVELESVGHGAPEQIKEAGFREIEADRTSLMPQVASQFSPLFLLDEKGSVAAEVLSDVGRLADVQEALKQVKSDRRENENDLRVREDDLEEVREDLTEYDGLGEDMKQIEEAREYHDRIVELENEIEQLKEYKERAKTLRSQINELEGIEELDVPEFEDDSELEALRMLVDWRETRNDIILKIKGIQGVEDVEIPSAPNEEYEEVQTLVEYRQQRDELQAQQETLEDIAHVELPDNDADEAFDDVSTLRDWIEQRNNLVDAIKSLKQKAKSATTDLTELEEKIEEWFHEAGQCPICEQEYE